MNCVFDLYPVCILCYNCRKFRTDGKIWYEKLTPQDKVKVKQLISQKRLEFVFCGYVVNDEATPFYNDIIDNIRLGHQFLFDTVLYEKIRSGMESLHSKLSQNIQDEFKSLVPRIQFAFPEFSFPLKKDLQDTL